MVRCRRAYLNGEGFINELNTRLIAGNPYGAAIPDLPVGRDQPEQGIEADRIAERKFGSTF